MPNLRTGYVLNNRYRIVKRIGGGGFGDIYRAWDLNLGRACAVKENLETSQAAQQQFEQEAMILAQLSHPNLPRVTDHFVVPGQGQYLVMDYVDGEDLQEMLDRGSGPLAEAQVLGWVEQVCSALAYLHGQNPPIIHRDIKPANIKIAPDDKAYLVDFGIAKLYGPSAKTTRGARAVTPGYSPPEQYGQGRTDGRTDIYALGATLYTLLTGQEPPESVQVNAGQAVLPPVRTLNPGVTPVVEAAVQGAMETRPDDRYQEVNELLAALRATRPTPPGITRVTTPVANPILVNRDLLIRLAGVAVVAVLVVMAVVYFATQAEQMPIPTLTSIAQVPTPAQAPRTPTPGQPTSTVTATSVIGASTAGPRASPTEVAKTVPPRPTKTFTPRLPTSTRPPILTVPNGNRIAFNSDRTGNNDIYVMNTDGSNVRQLTTSGSNDTVPSWAPNGEKFAFQSNDGGDMEIFIYALNSGNIRQLTNNNCNDYNPVWSPDSRQLVYYSDCDGNREIYRIDVDGIERQQLTRSSSDQNYFAYWSPDGRQIVYSAYRSGRYQVYVMNADGTGQRAVTSGCKGVFSPDGEWILYTEYCFDLGGLYLIRPDGTDRRVLDERYNSTNPSWSPDGSKIIFQSDRSGNEDIWMMDKDGSNWVQLTRDPGRDSAPVWQPG